MSKDKEGANEKSTTKTQRPADGFNVVMAYKVQPSQIHLKIIEKWREKGSLSKDGKISLPQANFILSHYVRLKKDEMEFFYYEMKEMGLIEICPFHFIKILNVEK